MCHSSVQKSGYLCNAITYMYRGSVSSSTHNGLSQFLYASGMKKCIFHMSFLNAKWSYGITAMYISQCNAKSNVLRVISSTSTHVNFSMNNAMSQFLNAMYSSAHNALSQFLLVLVQLVLVCTDAFSMKQAHVMLSLQYTNKLVVLFKSLRQHICYVFQCTEECQNYVLTLQQHNVLTPHAQRYELVLVCKARSA